MHSLKFSVTSDLATKKPWPNRLSSNAVSSNTERSFKLKLNNNKNKVWRCCRIVACAVDRNGSEAESPGLVPGQGSEPDLGTTQKSSSLSRTQIYALLKQQMDVAAKSEDYKEAARIRDSLKTLEEDDPVLRLRRLLKEAIEDERFEDAAGFRDQLNEIDPLSLLKCSSDATTLGIRVQVRSVYIKSRSDPSRDLYFFAYRIRISNNSDRPVQLLRRHWIITDANENTEHVRGNGVIGEQPVILPNSGFEYTSACPLSTPSGRMEGEFEMKHVDPVGSTTFNVAIAPFCLSTSGDGDNDF
ncbi:OLC1v1013162C1 [Oldenlandia corymbosa var. corymbosa]|uniref:OLC1v1013162C1 n=1 Tax=Oldenlandia corymbosa var. corymbosa TaxID=529605 RepID=A0AAV1E050_OLDCO|nr:OLC1v1013162C1 [Oldenlandia corymbosa var. corymbosa]